MKKKKPSKRDVVKVFEEATSGGFRHWDLGSACLNCGRVFPKDPVLPSHYCKNIDNLMSELGVLQRLKGLLIRLFNRQ